MRTVVKRFGFNRLYTSYVRVLLYETTSKDVKPCMQYMYVHLRVACKAFSNYS